ncbi:hypothetical protein H0B56_13460 [Haloechinothrix sp. YIM 98757]|uniref:Uncharacterized protein n=1 Tax=Haloechinothrix aidingensis TaxID=2752311 RepID=A0A838ABD7_9PSEU|nr:hypothetical protein [Haloechinothrix aidingensis]MBA0126553.1 hypothetical protein [Haloechinothrix aidingensis]
MDLVTRAGSQWDRLLAAAALIAGVVVLTLGWYRVSGTPYPAEQLPYIISAGLGGLFLLGASATLWLSADLHDEWRKLDRIERAIREERPAEPSPEPTRPLPTAATEGAR